MYLKLALKFGPYVLIAVLIGVVLFMHGNNIKATSERDAAELHAKDLTDANNSLGRALAVVEKQQVDNAKIAEDVAAMVNANRVREVHTNTIIKEAMANDPEVRDWANQPIPSSVRDAINRPDKVGTPAP